MTTILHSGSQRCAQLCRFALMLGLGLSGATASATEWQIPSPNNGNAAAVTALTNALANCRNNDIVTLSSGVYDLAGIVSHSNETYGASHLWASKDVVITLRGDPSIDRENVVLKGDGTARILLLHKVGCKIENISFTNGFAKLGAVVCTDAADSSYGQGTMCTLSNCVFRCNVASNYGGVSSRGATLYNCLAESNRAENEAGVIRFARAIDTTFRGNRANSGGAGFQIDARGCVFEENSSEQDGGALKYNCTASNCVFRFNSAVRNGGAVKDSNEMRDCRFIENSSGDNGGAIHGQKKEVSGCWFESNWANATKSNGAIEGGSGFTFQVQNCIFTNNAAGWGNGVGGGSAVIWSNCLFVANQMRADSGGRAGVGGGTFYKCVFRGQTCASASNNSLSPTNSYAKSRRWERMFSVLNGNMFDCTVEGCVSGCRMTRCTIAGCTNTPVVIAGTSALTNCLVVGNRLVSDASANPLGLFYGDTSGADISLVNCTVADNQGTVFNKVGGDIANTIFFGNTEADITAKGTYGTALTFDHCLYRTCQSTASTAPVFSDCVVLGASETPKFNEMEDDAYPYYMTRPSSKSVNAGKAIAWESGAVDLCGNPRVRDDLVDIGCYESVIPRHSFIIIIR